VAISGTEAETPRLRSIRSARKIRMRLGAGFSFAEPFPGKLRGMHWGTYLQMRAAAGEAKRSSVEMMRKLLRALWDKKHCPALAATAVTWRSKITPGRSRCGCICRRRVWQPDRADRSDTTGAAAFRSWGVASCRPAPGRRASVSCRGQLAQRAASRVSGGMNRSGEESQPQSFQLQSSAPSWDHPVFPATQCFRCSFAPC
jgi:hypothetical protein